MESPQKCHESRTCCVIPTNPIQVTWVTRPLRSLGLYWLQDYLGHLCTACCDLQMSPNQNKPYMLCLSRCAHFATDTVHRGIAHYSSVSCNLKLLIKHPPINTKFRIFGVRSKAHYEFIRRNEFPLLINKERMNTGGFIIQGLGLPSGNAESNFGGKWQRFHQQGPSGKRIKQTYFRQL